MEPAIEVRDLTKIFSRRGSDTLAVDRINFTVPKGEVFGFLGPNGAGKTTTQRMLSTLLTPTAGKVSIFGHDLAHDAYPVKQQLGLVPEEANVYTELSAWNNLMFTGRIYRLSAKERHERSRELLETFGLWEQRKQKVEEYSKGMRRRLSIAMALIHRPRLLFLDEPTPGLDAQSTRTIRDLIRQLNRAGTTIFLTTHQIEEANQLCDRVAIIHEGRIAAIDTPERLKQTFQKVQSVEVALQPDSERLRTDLSALPGVTTALKVGDKWRLYTEHPSPLLSHLLDYTQHHQLEVVSLTTRGPSLEDVFLEITGQHIGAVKNRSPENHSSRPHRRA